MALKILNAVDIVFSKYSYLVIYLAFTKVARYPQESLRKTVMEKVISAQHLYSVQLAGHCW